MSKVAHLSLFCIFAFDLFFSTMPLPNAKATSSHILIVEVQIAGLKATDEFVELFNPTNSEINLERYKLKKKSSTGSETLLVSNFPNVTIPAYSYFLITHPTDYSGLPKADLIYSTSSQSLAKDNSILVLNNNNEVIDILGWGKAVDFEGQTAHTPEGGLSLQRAKEEHNIFIDTDNNMTDFSVTPSEPQTSSEQNIPIVPILPSTVAEILPLESKTETSTNTLNDPTTTPQIPDASTPVSSQETTLPDTTTSSTTIETAEPETTPLIDTTSSSATETTLGNSDSSSSSSNTSITDETGTAVHDTPTSPSTNTDTEPLSPPPTVNTTSPEISSPPPSTTQPVPSSHSVSSSTLLIPNIGEIVINEFLVDPQNNDVEWVELYNRTNQAFELDTLVLVDGSHAILKISGTLSAYAFITFDFPSTRLNNSGDTILLIRNTQTLNAVTYGDWNDGNLDDNAPSPGKGFTSARKTNGTTSENNRDDFVVTTLPTKGSPNMIQPPPIISPTPSSSNNAQNTAEPSSTVPRQEFQTGDMVINELLANPIGSDETEWIELKNNDTRSINLLGWKLRDQSGSTYTINAEDSINTDMLASEFFLVKKIISSIAQNNQGDTITLIDPFGQTKDIINFGEMKEGVAYARNNANIWLLTNTPTPASTNIIKETYIPPVDETQNMNPEPPKPLDSTLTTQEETANARDSETWQFLDSSIRLNEIFPNPSGKDNGKEWVEITNISNQPIEVTGWYLQNSTDDVIGVISAGITAHGFHIISMIEPLKNKREMVQLRDANGKLVDVVSYETATSNQSYARVMKGWLWTKQLTAGIENIVSEDTENETEDEENTINTPVKKKKQKFIFNTSLEEIRNMEGGEIVRLSGVVSVEAGILGKQIMYITGSPGIQLYSHTGTWPTLRVGDTVEVTGTYKQTMTGSRILIADTTDIIITKNDNEPAPEQVNNAVDEELEGHFIEIEGEIIELHGSSLLVQTPEDEVKVVAKKSTGIVFTNFSVGDTVNIRGLVSINKGGVQLWPRYERDILLLKKAEKKVAPPPPFTSAENSHNTLFYLGASTFACVIIAQMIKEYKKRKVS